MPLHSRPRPFRDARTFVLALAGESTGEEFRYFEALCAAELVDQRKVAFVLIPTPADDHRSAPRDVLDRCVSGRAPDDPTLVRRWLVIDVDTWPDAMLSETCQEAVSRGIGLAVSNPCFELWLLLHYQDLSSEDHAELAGVDYKARSKEIQRRCRAGRDGASRAEIGEDLVRAAIKRARALIQHEGSRWPEFPGTFVVRLVEELAQAGALRGLHER